MHHRSWMWLLALVLTGWVLTATTAQAGTPSTQTTPPPPTMDFSVLPETANVLPKNPDGKPHQVHARLLTDADVVPAGGTIRVGVHLKQQKDWHTYWKAPGDIGLPTDIQWTLPDGWAADTYQYPVPERFEADEMVSYGYNDQVLLFSTMSVPTDATGEAKITASVSWLVCKTSCIPGSATLSTTVQIGDRTPSSFTPLFDHFEAQHPRNHESVSEFAIRAVLSPPTVRPDEAFSVVFDVTPRDGVALQASSADTFLPVAGLDVMVNDIEVTSPEEGSLRVTLNAETFAPEPLPTDDSIGGLFRIKANDELIVTEFNIPLPWATNSPPASEDTPDQNADPATDPAVTAPPMSPSLLLINLLMAFGGGLLLNIMPCVFPVLLIKLQSLIMQTEISTTEKRNSGLLYTAGILVSFWILAASIIALKLVFGLNVGWGFQFQFPMYVAALATIVFVFGLSLFGVFEIPALGANTAGQMSQKEGAAGFFFTGMFCTLLATPCSAPFMGTAIAFALQASAPLLVAIFTMIGLGLAAPFLIIAFVPALFRLLPQPGEWMDWFKQFLGFTLIATTIWLVDVLLAQIGPDRTTGFLAFLMFCAMGAWIFGRWGGLTVRRQLTALGVAISVAVAGGWMFLDMEVAHAEECDDGSLSGDLDFGEEIPWQGFTENRLAAISDQVIFVDFTADWCLTCKFNEQTILETEAVRETMARLNVVPLKADWTNRNPVITEWLLRYQKAGVPFYLVFPRDSSRDPIPLPEVITPEMVINALQDAS